ncbi:MAG: PQQ-dependent dehydrogenase, methanol/ethanol family [Gammaproteobacteria bacterium]|nr:PQQ-dependent dehydrogenase, methanol/ethanol family [Gammaproteobacteria bacterium]
MTFNQLRIAFAAVTLAALVACDDSPSSVQPGVALDATPPASGDITRERLLNASRAPENWLTTGFDSGKSHFSPLARINRTTVSQLGLAWSYETHTNRGLEATPIIVDGVLFTSGVNGRVYALDAVTGAERWLFDPQIDPQVNRVACCDAVNRGVAVWEGRVYVAALDGRLFALDAASGIELWQVDTIIDKTRGYSSTGAPEMAGDVVVIGNAGAEYDARGYVSAYDRLTGELNWRFYIVPGPADQPYEHIELERAATTWDPNSRFDVGGGGTAWDGIVYDPELNLVYVGTGNAALYNRNERSPAGGDNLYLSSILAINATTGRLAWHYQETPGDQWDYTATAPMILTQLTVGGTQRKVLLHAPKNGFFYVLDRATGELLSAEKFAPANWASHVDLATGRPAISTAADYADGPALIYPWTGGAHSWNPMAFSPMTGLVYIPIAEAAIVLFDPTDGHEYHPGQRNTSTYGMSYSGAIFGAPELSESLKAKLAAPELWEGAPAPRGGLRAWDPVAQQARWEVTWAQPYDHGGVLATGGDLVVQGGLDGRLNFYDAENGALLYSIETGSSIIAAPATYEVGGEQYIVVMAAAGGGPLAFAPPPDSAAYKYGNQGRILAFKLGGEPVSLPPALPPEAPIPLPPPVSASTETITRGARLFGDHCIRCHPNTVDRPRTASADLRRMSAATHAAFEQILLGGTLQPLGMPRWDDVLDDEDVTAIHQYLITTARAAYDAEND